MKKHFNTTGVCKPEKHFMVNISNKIAQILDMVENGDYFVINRPRQYGKTTTIDTLNRRLKLSEDYFPIKISFEGISEGSFKEESLFIKSFLRRLKRVLDNSGNINLIKFMESVEPLNLIDDLDEWISNLIMQIGKKTVLIIDEVDKSSNNQLFLDFLAMLRNKYLLSDDDGQSTFHSVILVGVHDVKSLKLKIRPEAEAKYNSPWNIAVNFKVDLSFSPTEIATMLEQYASEQEMSINIHFFSERLFYYTSGYPFLVSLLCKTIDEDIIAGKNQKEWKPEDLEKAVQLILKEDNTNFESLITKLKNNAELYDFIFNLIMNGTEFSFNIHNEVIHFGTMYGILREEKGRVLVHNRIYEQIIYNFMASKSEISGKKKFDHITSTYLEGDQLNIQKIFLKFQEFMNENYSKRDADFIERNGRLLFLAFIRPIINGRGFDFKEIQISEEKRLDVVITFNNNKYIVELKIWRGESYHREGIRQLCNYLECQNQNSGYLLIYDLRRESGQAGKMETIDNQGKTILAAWV
ncbi:MAG: AAA family ATPase [Candidatus Omnitrophota bacterium]